jgi:hypothetical protein
MKELGATAIAQSAPTNPNADLGTSLAETFREGVPSLPGIQSWKNRTNILRAAGSEYLNYQFGWAPLVSEVHGVVNAARYHRDIMNQYHHGEGSNTRRRFDFARDASSNQIVIGGFPGFGGPGTSLSGQSTHFGPQSQRKISLVKETKRWFEGCFTYGLPSTTPSWGKALGFGTEADKLFGLRLDPEILWELTPWSWAADWFSNVGDVLHNVSSFALAGLVMRYGYIMEESIERVTAEQGPQSYTRRNKDGTFEEPIQSSPCSSGYECITKRRVAASPFGFSIGWEDLSPTQLAITAAVGITKLL